MGLDGTLGAASRAARKKDRGRIVFVDRIVGQRRIGCIRDEIAKAGLTSRKRGRKVKAEDPRVKELERENARLQRRLARVETMLEIQKKASELLGIPLNPPDDEDND